MCIPVRHTGVTPLDGGAVCSLCVCESEWANALLEKTVRSLRHQLLLRANSSSPVLCSLCAEEPAEETHKAFFFFFFPPAAGEKDRFRLGILSAPCLTSSVKIDASGAAAVVLLFARTSQTQSLEALVFTEFKDYNKRH